MSMPKWNVLPPPAMRGSQRKPRTGCWAANGFNGQGYAGRAGIRCASVVGGEAVDACVVRFEWRSVRERAAGDGYRPGLVAAWVCEHGSVADSGREAAEANLAVLGRASPHCDHVEGVGVLPGADGDVCGVGGNRVCCERGGERGGMWAVAEFAEQWPEHTAPVTPVPPASLVLRVHRVWEVAAEEEESAGAGGDRVVGHEASFWERGEDKRVLRRQDSAPGDLQRHPDRFAARCASGDAGHV